MNDQNYSNEDEINFLKIFKSLLNQKYLIFSCTIIVTIASIIYALFSPPLFESHSKWLPNEKSKSSKFGGLAALTGLNLGSDINNETYYPELLTSPLFLKQLYEKSWKTLNSTNISLIEFLNIDTLSLNKNESHVELHLLVENNLYKFLINSIKYSAYPTSLNLTVTTSDPILSYEINKFLMEKLEEYNKQEKSSKARQEKEFIEERFTEFKTSLSKAENILKKFRERNLNINSPSLLLEQQRLIREVEINNQLVIEFRKQLELAKVEEVKETPEFKIIQEPTIPIHKSKPKKKQIAIIGTFLGFILGCMFALLRSWWQENGKRIKEELNS